MQLAAAATGSNDGNRTAPLGKCNATDGSVQSRRHRRSVGADLSRLKHPEDVGQWHAVPQHKKAIVIASVGCHRLGAR
jgi:hypothetical protein